MAATRRIGSESGPAVQGVVVDLPVRPGRCRCALRTPVDVARELARVYRAARARRMPTDEAARLTFILATLARILESSGFDERLNALEQRHADRAAGGTTRPA